jgi:hypothetical protein
MVIGESCIATYYPMFRPQDGRVFDKAGNVIETRQHEGQFKE